MSDAPPEVSTPASARAKAGTAKRRGNRTTRIPEILDCAIRVFATSGDAGFTQRRIAAEAGIRLGTLQHYFDSREALLRAAIEESSGRYLQALRELVTDFTRAPEERLEILVDQTFATFSDPQTLISPFALESWSLAEHNEWMREITERVTESYHALFSDLVGQLNPKLTVEESWIRGAFIYSHWQGLLVFLRRSKFGRVQPMALKDSVKSKWVAVAKDKP
ncbi:MAG: TetR/AcrR family transcriptional regulator [Janthinobacterium lividum]